MGFKHIDHAALEYDSDETIQGVLYEQRMERYPTGSNRLLLPIHAYFSRDHMDSKGALFCRPGEREDQYEIATAYWDGHGGSVTQPLGEWQERSLYIDSNGDFVAEVETHSGEWVELARRSDTPEDELVEIDVMTELQYDRFRIGSIPDFDLVTILTGVITSEGVRNPVDVLSWSGVGETTERAEGRFCRLEKREDDAGRYWFFHSVEKPWYYFWL